MVDVAGDIIAVSLLVVILSLAGVGAAIAWILEWVHLRLSLAREWLRRLCGEE